VEYEKDIYKYEEKATTFLQKFALVSLGSCKDQTSWCSKKFGRPIMKFYLEK